MIWRENKFTEAKLSSSLDLDSKKYWGEKNTQSISENVK